MLNFAHICPTAYIQQYAQYNSIHLILAHLVEEDEQYRDFYYNLKDSKFKIMDNSAFEMYKQGKPMYDSSKLIEMGKACRADYIVMSDYPAEPCTKTSTAAENLISKIKDNGFKTFYCPQSEIGKTDDLLEAIEWGIDNEGIDLIGISILNTPNAFGVERNNNLQRYLSRYEIFRLLRERRPPCDKTYKRFHCLGMVDGPKEIILLKQLFKHYIFSWDSSAAIWSGIHEISFDNSPTGLINGKFEKEVNFQHDIPLTHPQDTTIIQNIEYINRLLK